ncbi:amidohydrolase [Saccharopolyspora mangrovi]|uniref:Amidohydrolase n=1 Tax=Saccharopolyspora mangrovi TaxID=3082379 RepID=A0ABU6AHX6_9PSEU|nr:amidohydrolase [Saccharopolyspora sp. S2-29]MEB3370920.1 amidohydrolase [Saccharopolyspora sp. S2-29]
MTRNTEPEIVIVNAEVSSAVPGATSVAVTGGRVHAVDRESLDGLAGPRTEVIDARGATLLPGFTDAHVHPLAAGVQILTCDLSGLPHSPDRYRDAICSYAAEHPDLGWISGNGWYGDTFPGGLPHRDFLDEILPDRPAVFVSHDAHGVWANSRALALAGIDDATPDPHNGRIDRDHDGRATGILVERAGDLVTSLLPPVTDEFVESALLAAQAHLHSMGITGWQDACVGSLWGLPDPLQAYQKLAEEGRLTARVIGALWWSAEKGLEQIPSLVEKRSVSAVGRFRATSVKIMQDGVCENCTGAMLKPYAGNFHRGAVCGLSFIDPEQLQLICQELDRRRFQIHLHAVGDRAVRECLDALEAASKVHSGHDNRHQIAHLDVVSPDDVPRFAELGVIANIQALWARRDSEIVERKLPLLGPEREPHHFPFGDLHRKGARLAMGSDWPVTDPNPLWAIYTAANRLGPPEDPHATGAEALTVPLEETQAIDQRVALEAYTAGSAYANHAESEIGRIAPGMFADLVLLDRPILSGERVSAARPLLTLVEGQAVYREA